MNIIVSTIIIVTTLGLIVGIFLTIASKKLEVEENETLNKIKECLPGINCGGCGYAGCDSLANAIFNNEAVGNECVVGGKKIADMIATITGKSVSESNKKVAFVHCNGNCDNVKKVYNYVGEKSCALVFSLANNGEKSCRFSCIGYGDCVKACQFNAISIVNGVAVVDNNNCVSCSKCINVCPAKIIELVDFNKKHLVRCNNKDKGSVAKNNCQVACIGCKICEKNCPKEAIKVNDNLAKMNYEKCDDCGVCAEKCPQKVIM